MTAPQHPHAWTRRTRAWPRLALVALSLGGAGADGVVESGWDCGTLAPTAQPITACGLWFLGVGVPVHIELSATVQGRSWRVRPPFSYRADLDGFLMDVRALRAPLEAIRAPAGTTVKLKVRVTTRSGVVREYASSELLRAFTR